MAVPKPTNINDWIIWGDLTESVLLKYEIDVWDSDYKQYYLEVEHRPTNIMRWVHQLENSQEPTYDRTTDTYKTRFLMSKVGIVKARTDGDYILMLCDYSGKDTSLIEQINKRLYLENQRLRRELSITNASAIRTQAIADKMAKHPEQVFNILLRMQQKLRKGTAPAVIQGQAYNPSVEDDGE